MIVRCRHYSTEIRAEEILCPLQVRDEYGEMFDFHIAIIILPHDYVENHHQYEAKGETDGRKIGVRAVGGFGDQFFDHYV